MTDKQQNIHIIATGGTIDAHFSPKEYKPVPNDESYIKEFITNYIKPHFKVHHTTASMIDSLYMNDDIREKIYDEIAQSSHDKILITHGTDGMIKTAQFLSNKINDKSIVLVGSMIPLKGFSPSDGGFSLGFAIGNLLHLPFGVYISMNGQIFTADNVQKNIEKSRFEFKESS